MISTRTLLLCCGFAALVAGGCRKATPSSEGAAGVQKSFKTTRSDIREFADQGVVAEARGDFGTAFVHYRALSLNPELSPEQRNAANAQMLEMTKKLRDASEKGDTEAEKVLKNYRATK